MLDSAPAVLKGVIAALAANGPVAALVGARIYSDVPQAATFPYLVVAVASEPFAANSFSGQTHTVRITAYSRESTAEKAMSLRKAALDALDRTESAITLDVGTLVKCEYAGFGTVFQEDDGRTWQAVGELEVVVT